MTPTAAGRPTPRTLRVTVAGLVVASVCTVGTLVHQSASSAAPPSSEAPRAGDRGGGTADPDGAPTEEDGVLPHGVTVFDDEHPGVAELDPELHEALREATTDAAHDGIEIHVNSGWRSREYQDELVREAVARYGSEEEAARWVASADTSAHVSGDAVDIGDADATAWLADRGAGYGLCRVYRNEPWHYELRPAAVDRGCPPMYADPTEDPRMRP